MSAILLHRRWHVADGMDFTGFCKIEKGKSSVLRIALLFSCLFAYSARFLSQKFMYCSQS